MSPATQLPEFDQQRAITMLTALATARDADAVHEARMTLIRSGLPMAQDPFAPGPCPADDPAAGHDVNLGCPTTKRPDGTPEHVRGHRPVLLVIRIAHCSRVARERRQQKGAGRG